MARKLTYHKKAVSTIIATVILVALVLVAAVSVWAVVNTLISKQSEKSEACFGNFDKVTLNGLYTCYDSVNEKLRFSISMGDIDVEKVVVGVSAEGNTYSFKITHADEDCEGCDYVYSYPVPGEDVILPGRNGGKTYVFDLTGAGVTPGYGADQIRIIPVIDGEQCDVSDIINDISNCLSYA